MIVSVRGGLKDFMILTHIYGYAAGMMLFTWLHPDPSIVAVAFPTISGLLGFTHWFLIRDDKEADAPH